MKKFIYFLKRNWKWILLILVLVFGIWWFRFSNYDKNDNWNIVVLIGCLLIFWISYFISFEGNNNIEWENTDKNTDYFWVKFLWLIWLIVLLCCYLFSVYNTTFEFEWWMWFIVFILLFLNFLLGMWLILKFITNLFKIINLELKAYLSADEVNSIIYWKISMYRKTEKNSNK